MQLAIRLDTLPGAVKFKGKSKLKADKDGIAFVDVDTLIPAFDKAMHTNTKNDKTFYVVSKEGEHKGKPLAKVLKVRVEDISYERMGEYINYFKNLASRLKLGIHIHHSHGKALPPVPEKDEVLHVFPHSSPGTDKVRKSLEFDGKSLGPLGSDFLLPTFMGTVFGDEDGLAMAEWNGRNCHVLWDFQHIHADDGLGESILDKIFTGKLKLLDKRHFGSMKKVQAKVAEMVKRDHSKYTNEHAELTRKVEDLSTKIVTYIRDLDSLNRLISNYDQAIEDRTQSIIKEIQDISNLRGVMTVSFDGKKLEVSTLPIVVKGRNLGRFQITVDDRNVRFKPLDSFGGHPHINGNGPCFGDMKVSINKMVARREYLALTSFLLNFLHTYNEADNYTSIGQLGVALKKGEKDKLSDGVIKFEPIEGFDPSKSLVFEDGPIEPVEDVKKKQTKKKSSKGKAKKAKGADEPKPVDAKPEGPPKEAEAEADEKTEESPAEPPEEGTAGGPTEPTPEG